jgi:hypothetical protein
MQQSRSDSLKKAQEKYQKEKTTLMNIRLNKEKDKDIIDQLRTKASKQGYIKQLIRNDVTNEEIERLEISLLNTLDHLMSIEAYSEAKALINELITVKQRRKEISKGDTKQ